MEPIVEIRGPETSHPEPQPPADRIAVLNEALRKRTPHAFVTPSIVFLNVLLFVLMVATGVDAVAPSADRLLSWGGDFGPKTLNGDFWRLVTCTFIHAGFLHLAFNMWALLGVGLVVERLAGNVGFLILYLLSGAIGSLASCFWHPLVVGVGASGAVFGVYGGLFGLSIRRGSVPFEAVAKLRNGALGFLGYNLFFSLTSPHIDMAAHLGGLVAGFVGGAVLSRPFLSETRAEGRNLCVAAVGSVVVLIGLMVVPAGADDVDGELSRFQDVEGKAINTVNGLEKKYRDGGMTDEQLAKAMSTDVLPEWRSARMRLAGLKIIPPRQQKLVAGVLSYAETREQAWEALVEGLHEANETKLAEFKEKSAAAQAMVQKLNGDQTPPGRDHR